jgi:hypothetical protein
VKRRVLSLSILAAMLVVIHIIDAYWLVMPSFHRSGISVSWMDVAAPIGVGGIWCSFFLSHLKRAPLLPRHDPGLQFAFTYA